MVDLSIVMLNYQRVCILVGGIPTPLKNIGQLGWWHSQNDGKNKSHVPNHQPAYICCQHMGYMRVESSIYPFHPSVRPFVHSTIRPFIHSSAAMFKSHISIYCESNPTIDVGGWLTQGDLTLLVGDWFRLVSSPQPWSGKVVLPVLRAGNGGMGWLFIAICYYLDLFRSFLSSLKIKHQ